MKEYPVKTIYFKDELNDDFASTKISRKKLPKNFKFYHRNLIYRFFSNLVYYVVGVPLIWIYVRLILQAKVVGKKKWKKAHLRGTGVFIYGNHTSANDALYVPSLLILPKRAWIVCSDEAVSNAFLRPIETFLGALPLPDTPEAGKPFVDAVNAHIRRKDVVLIFPEAHIWPYSTRIRPFGEHAFTYPANLGAPVVTVCTTFERRKILRFLPPRPVIHVSEPDYPDMDLPLGERAKRLRDASYDYMVEVSSSLENVEYYRYRPAKEETSVSLLVGEAPSYNSDIKEDA